MFKSIKQLFEAFGSANLAALKKASVLFVTSFGAQVAALGTTNMNVKALTAVALSVAHVVITETWPVLAQIRSAAKRQNVVTAAKAVVSAATEDQANNNGNQ